MTETNKALGRRWFREVWNEGREATIDELFAQGGVAYGLGDGEAEVRGPAQLYPLPASTKSVLEIFDSASLGQERRPPRWKGAHET